MSLPAFLAGFLRIVAGDYEFIWTFTPFVDLSIYRWIRRNVLRPRLDWQIAFFMVIVMLSFVRIELGRAFPHYFFTLDNPQWAINWLFTPPT